MVVAPVSAAPPQPVVIPNNGSLLGLGYGGLSVSWQKFVNGQPAATNPLLDTTGRNCAVGQHGPVFFLVGGFGPSKVNRDCTVPAGKLLFFPLVNCNWIHVPLDVPGIGDDKTTVDEVWAALQSPTEGCGPRDNASGLSASVDKVAIDNLDPSTTPYYVCAGPSSKGCTAPAFSLTFPADNLFTSFGVPLPAGTYFPVVADGYYLLLAPLRPGVHTIAFGGSAGVASNAFTQDITYTLRVTDSD